MMFTRDDWTLFRNLNTLGQKAGVPKERLAALAVKELADNALDAGARCLVEQDEDGWISVADDGPGIEGSDEDVARLFSIRRPLSSSKLFRLPTRGALGNGLRVVAGAVLSSGGQLVVFTRGRMLKLTPRDDGGTMFTRLGDWEREGTVVKVKFGGELARQRGVLDLARLAIAMRGVSRYEGKTSPHWYDADSFFEVLQAVEDAEVNDLLSHFATKYRAKPGVKCSELSRDDASSMLHLMRLKSSNPPASKLGEVGPGVFSCHGYAKKTGKMEVSAGRGGQGAEVPVVVEVWATKLPKDGTAEAEIFINRTPITAKVSSGKDGPKMWIAGCGLSHYFKTGKFPMQVRICVTAPYMPITTDGKEPNLRPILGVVNATIESAARKAKAATSSGQAPLSKKQAILDRIPDAAGTASGEGKHRFSLRQLFYAVRPLLQEDGFDGELDYNYFSSVVTDYEQAEGRDVPGMYRDTRGVLYHPHTGEQIALGTLNVEKYKRPEYRFNKVLYIEKGGFFPLLIDAKWPERHDCALLTSQGFASRAARDVIDLMGDSDEELLFFCIHDADGPGTMIYQALVEGTRARPGRKVKVVNLGLDPWEGRRMGLQSEEVHRVKGKVPVARYVTSRTARDLMDMEVYPEGFGSEDDWEEWLQSNRYELNAMTSPQFLAWLDGKMKKFDSLGKVVPPGDELRRRLRHEAALAIRQQIMDELARANDVDKLVATMADAALSGVTEGRLEEMVREELAGRSPDPWEVPIRQLAKKAVSQK